MGRFMMAGIRLIFLLMVVVTYCQALLVNYNKCSDGTKNLAQNISVDVSDCFNPKNCTLIKGNTHFLTTTFIPTVKTADLRQQIWGLIGPMRFPHGRAKGICDSTVGVDSFTCQDTKGLVPGKKYVHTAKFPVLSIYPEMSLKVRVLYFVNRSTKVLCYELPVIIGPGAGRG